MIYFLSDVHLGLEERAADRERERLLCAFLRRAQDRCQRLFIVGDLFDYWFEYGTVIPKFHVRTLASLADYVERGIAVDYLLGNHDFGHRDYFERELGVRVHAGDLEITLGGKRFYLAHGDGKALNDEAYRAFRAVTRSPLALRLWRWLHPDAGITLAAAASKSSRARDEERGEGDDLEIFARKRLAEGFDAVIMGHQHAPLEKQMHSGVYVNLGDWLTHYTLAEFNPAADNSLPRLRRLREVLDELPD
jgi:UDP-2,3-diacylglucosamine hydrolase